MFPAKICWKSFVHFELVCEAKSNGPPKQINIKKIQGIKLMNISCHENSEKNTLGILSYFLWSAPTEQWQGEVFREHKMTCKANRHAHHWFAWRRLRILSFYWNCASHNMVTECKPLHQTASVTKDCLQKGLFLQSEDSEGALVKYVDFSVVVYLTGNGSGSCLCN